MRRVSKAVTAGIVAGAVLLGGTRQAAAQATTTTIKPSTTTSKTTTTTSTTTTTLLPHPFSAATAACIRRARADFRACRRAGTGAACATAFQTAFPNCFAPGAGVTCAKKCVTTESTCLGKTPTTRKDCRKACFTTRKADRRACRRIADGDNLWAGGDASCLTTAQANFDLCRFVCTEAVRDCHVALKFCIANCANL